MPKRSSRPIARLGVFGLVMVAAFAVPIVMAATINIAATNYTYTPKSPQIHVGDTVTWSFAGEPHSVTSGTTSGGVGVPDGKFDSGILVAGETYALGPGQAENPFTAPGTYPYFCEIHAEQMTGTVVVLENATPTPKATPAPTPRPTPRPTPAPTLAPTPTPTDEPSLEPSASPSAEPSPSETTAAASPTPTAAPSSSGDGGGDGGSAAPLAIVVALASLALGFGALYLRRRGGE